MFRWCSHQHRSSQSPHLFAEAGRLRLCWLPTSCWPRRLLYCAPVSARNSQSPFYPLAPVLQAVREALPEPVCGSWSSAVPTNRFPPISRAPLLAGGCKAGQEPQVVGNRGAACTPEPQVLSAESPACRLSGLGLSHVTPSPAQPVSQPRLEGVGGFGSSAFPCWHAR